MIELVGDFMSKDYKTLLQYAEAEEIINKSKFIGYAKPVDSEDEAIEFIEQIKKKHWNATHNVPVYIIGENNEIQRYSDDGEPSGTAGVPILEMLKKEEIKNLVIVVTRYFGGIKLGTGGLVRAYTSAAKLAINEAKVVEKVRNIEYLIRMDYTLHGKIQNELINSEYIIKDTIYDDKVNIFVYCKTEESNKFVSMITDISNGKAIIEEKEEVYLTIHDGKVIEE
ncbi:YigZ family protein [Wukongibacter sp. M2B1]|uniref:YigZ family protein n=1 Tax=Wukongibacter sp. M2B1 TaxID=3088895 RepID=UPI003D7A9A78